MLVAGCTGPKLEPSLNKSDLTALETNMENLFTALEMYAQDHTLNYPENVSDLIPKYIDVIPLDPVNGQPLIYTKTERGYFLTTSVSYISLGVDEGFPKMDQDGFMALKASDFPSEEL